MSDREYNRERRRQIRLERLGTNQPKCLFCLEDDPSCLELHHLSGKDFGETALLSAETAIGNFPIGKKIILDRV
jgi:hypothetical protein